MEHANEMIKLGEDAQAVVSYIINYYCEHSISNNTADVKQLYMKLNQIYNTPKKKRNAEIAENVSKMSSMFKSSSQVNYLKKIGDVSITDIETILANNEHIDEADKLVGQIKVFYQEEKITYDMFRILYSIIAEENRKNVLRLVLFVCTKKTLQIEPIEYLELPQSLPKDIVWYMWFILLAKAKAKDKQVYNYVHIHMQLYTLAWSKKNKDQRINLIAHLFNLVYSSNPLKYIHHETPNKGTPTPNESISFIQCITYINKDLIQQVEE